MVCAYCCIAGLFWLFSGEFYTAMPFFTFGLLFGEHLW